MGFFSKIAGSAIGALGSVAGSLLGANSSADAQQANYNAQKEFAKNGIRWRVEDAKAAGIHPLAALGAHTQSFSPVFQGQDYSGLAAAGQNIQRAIEAKTTQQERTLADLQVERAKLENEYLMSKIRDLDNQIVNRDFASAQAISAANAVRIQQRQPPMPSTSNNNNIGTYDQPKPGVVPYVVGDSYFEFPPEDVADTMEDPKAQLAWRAAIEAAYRLAPPDAMKLPLTKRHRDLIKAGTHEIVRIPGYGYAVKKKGAPKSSVTPPRSGGIRAFYGG